MKLLIPNAKELNTNLDNLPFQPLSAKSQVILTVLRSMSVEELAKFYQLKVDRAELEADRWSRIAQGQAKLYPAWQLYDGLMYRYMQHRDLSELEEAYLRETVFITTGFYGAISLFEPIAPHRLDFQGNLKIGQEGLKQFWRNQYDSVVADDDVIVSLLSSEFEAVFSPDVQKHFVKIVFMEDRAGKLKIHSTISKKGRGRMVSEMARHQVQTVEEIKGLVIDDFHYRADLSESHKLVFVRTVEL